MQTIYIQLLFSTAAAIIGHVSSRRPGPLSTTHEYGKIKDQTDSHTGRQSFPKYDNGDNPEDTASILVGSKDASGAIHEIVHEQQSNVLHDRNRDYTKQQQTIINSETEITERTQSEYNLESYDSSSYSSSDHDTIPGVAGTDFPDYVDVPLTSFSCHRYKQAGYYADIETGCQVFHVCDVDGRQDNFLCPRGTIFNQPYLTCDWWFNVDCSGAADYYGISTDLHRMATSATLQYQRERTGWSRTETNGRS